MRTDKLFTRFVGAMLALLLSGALNAAVATSGQQAGTAQAPTTSESVTQEPESVSSPVPNLPADEEAAASTTAETPVQPATYPLPDSPGAVRFASAQKEQPAQQEEQVQSPQPPQQQDQPWSPSAEPSGTAAAETVTSGGITASEPAGVAIAPAKQRRSRSLLLKVGALLGVGVAVGTVFALSMASDSRPPGSQ